MRTFILFLALATTACGASAIQTQARVANTVALAANTALPLLVERYKADGLAIIAAAPDRATAEARLEIHRVAWQPVWGRCTADPPTCAGGAWNSLRAAHDAWAAVLESAGAGEAVTAAHLLERARLLGVAYCELRASLPENARASMPDVPLAPCATTGGSQ